MQINLWPQTNDQKLSATRAVAPRVWDSAGDDEGDSLLDETAQSLTDTDQKTASKVSEYQYQLEVA